MPRDFYFVAPPQYHETLSVSDHIAQSETLPETLPHKLSATQLETLTDVENVEKSVTGWSVPTN
jgi:hypothetical protein